MKYFMLSPPPCLADYVRFFWVLEMEGLDGQPYVYRSMADGCAEIIFHYRGPFSEILSNCELSQAQAMVHAQTRNHRRFVTKEDFGIFGAYIYPSAIPSLFGYSATALSDEMPHLIDLLGIEGKNLEDAIMNAPDNGHRAELLSQFLIRRLATSKPTVSLATHAVRTIIEAKGNIHITALADHHGISIRQMERHFHDYAGFSPKTYARILRFQASMNEYGHSEKRLVDIALDCGYYDQAHFIHDFKAFSGYSPSEYFFGKPEGIEYRQV
jgi:AraC-like DNA-binding protein